MKAVAVALMLVAGLSALRCTPSQERLDCEAVCRRDCYVHSFAESGKCVCDARYKLPSEICEVDHE